MTVPERVLQGADRDKAEGLRRTVLLLLAAVALLPDPVRAQVPPDAAWRTVEGEHVRVTFPAELEALGREAAARGDRAWRRLAETFREGPEGKVEILLTDHLDASNGFARVAPFKQITVYARPPVDGFALSHVDDWLEVVLTHEMAHVFHLDVTGPVGEVARTVFGRVPSSWPFFPELGTPRWVIEGLATWYESRLSESGRVRGTYHEMVLRAAALEDRFEAVDEASGDSPVWPAGQRPYIYGSLFFDWLLKRYGEDRMSDFVDAVGGQLVPYRLDAAAREAFGVSFSEAWEAWREERGMRAEAIVDSLGRRAPVTEAERLTAGARFAVHARFAPDGRVVYARADGRSDSQLREARLGGTDRAGAAGEGGAGLVGDRHLVRTGGTSVASFAPEGDLVLAQLERRDPYRAYGDLYRLGPGGDVTRLTDGARLDHPSVAPDGRAAVAIQTGEGTTRLVEVALDGSGEAPVRPLTPFDADVHWAFPAVSPDGRWIAAARWRPGAYFDVVLLDRDGRVVEVVTEDRALDTAPAWSPDGRWLLWVSDRSGIQNLLAVPVDPEDGSTGPVRQVTNVVTGVHFPAVSHDGRWIVHSLYTADGWELARTPFDPDAWVEPAPLHPRFRTTAPGLPEAAESPPLPETPSEGYSPFGTLVPRYWEPRLLPSVKTRGVTVLEPSFGFATRGEDLVGRHAVDLQLLLSATGAKPTGSLGWQWSGLGNPLLSVRVSQGWDGLGPFSQEVEGEARTFLIEERERAATAAVTVLRERIRHRLSLTVGGGMVWERRTLLEPDLEPVTDLRLTRPDSRLWDLRATVGASTARGHALSVGLEEGVSAFVTGRTRSELDVPDALRGIPGDERSFDEVLGQLRAYTDLPGPGFADWVGALRVSAGAARGPGADAFHYDVGGAAGAPDPVTGLGLLGGRSYFFPARGFDNGDRVGRRAYSASAELRVPLALVNRGLGLFPLHLDRVSASLFVDAANAWGPELPGVPGFDNPRRDALASAGVEAVADLLTFFSIPVTVRAGLAAPISGGDGLRAYVRLGRPF